MRAAAAPGPRRSPCCRCWRRKLRRQGTSAAYLRAFGSAVDRRRVVLSSGVDSIIGPAAAGGGRGAGRTDGGRADPPPAAHAALARRICQPGECLQRRPAGMPACRPAACVAPCSSQTLRKPLSVLHEMHLYSAPAAGSHHPSHGIPGFLRRQRASESLRHARRPSRSNAACLCCCQPLLVRVRCFQHRSALTTPYPSCAPGVRPCRCYCGGGVWAVWKLHQPLRACLLQAHARVRWVD